ncbi:alpha/beta hydrolase [Rhodococcus triatomae]|uniref:Triacylglycerol lipase n=1 Tax=Rhodococcus triatomae TaxID=300028 RepID=A0A1G8G904_9NOCA|nr:alpha/beta hydrolase fold domain-containing protein [Rhodococcus triatomae]QNG20455.1 alpha/beta hydrolase [Rhodococcus triatomae]QNG23629.1 alpha/beta hydrolase [Rhodococcus triatomae]SDH90770.1 triacylglycerol lipase [Rhodococcus triatomae]
MTSTGSPVIRHDDVSRRAGLVHLFAQVLVKPLFTYWPLTDRGLAALARLEQAVDLLPKPRGVDIETVRLGGVRCERITHPRTATGDLRGASILYFHGGGFVFCGLATHRPLCGLLAAASGVPVTSVEYRQLPEGAIGASVADALAAYAALVEECEDPSKVIVAGDSAGGYLAMKIAEVATSLGLPAPVAVIGYSPLLNLDFEAHDRALLSRDAYLPLDKVIAVKERWLAGPDVIPGAQSPVDADPRGFPPVFFSAAENEMLRPDLEAMTATLHAAGRTVETHLWRGQIHAFPVIGKILRESRAIIGLSIDFAERAIGARRDVETGTDGVSDEATGRGGSAATS